MPVPPPIPYPPRTTTVAKAVAIIVAGRVVAFPTGTSYGLAADALQGHALQRLRNLKRRPREKALTVFMDTALWSQYLQLTDAECRLLAAAENMPLTLLVEPTPALAHLAQDGRVGLRVIDHPLMAELARAAGVPLTATSANVSGESPCYSPEAIAAIFTGKIDETTYDLSLGLILDGGTLPEQPPTTIAQLDNGNIVIVREGAVAAGQIQTLVRK